MFHTCRSVPTQKMTTRVRCLSALQEKIKTFPRPAQPLIMYEFDACPFCKKVRIRTWLKPALGYERMWQPAHVPAWQLWCVFSWSSVHRTILCGKQSAVRSTILCLQMRTEAVRPPTARSQSLTL